MAITYVGGASAVSTSVSLPSFTAGDIALVFACSNSATPTVPSGWTGVYSVSGTSKYGIVGYRVLQSGDTTSGTWTNANTIGVVVYRGQRRIYAIGATTGQYNGSSTTFSWPALARSAGRGSAVLMGMCTNSYSDLQDLTATGLTNRSSAWTANPVGLADSLSADIASNTFTMSSSDYTVAMLVSLYDDLNFPIIADSDTTTGTVTSNSDNWSLTVPSNIAAGDLLIGIVSADGNNTNPYVNFEGNVTQYGGVSGAPHTSGANCLRVTCAIATSSTGITATAVIGASEQGAWVIYRIPAGTFYDSATATDYRAGVTNATNTSTTPDPPSLNPANWDAEDTLWIVAVGVDTSRTVSDYSNWTSAGFFAYANYISGGSNGATLAVARLESGTSTAFSQEATGASNGFGRSTTDWTRAAQEFVSPINGTGGNVSVCLSKNGSPTDSVVLELQSDGGTTPTGTVLTTIATISNADIGTGATWFSYDFTATLTKGTSYWLVARRTVEVDINNYYSWAFDSTGVAGVTRAKYQSGAWVAEPTGDFAAIVIEETASVDPGTITISSSDDWVAATIAIRPAAQPKSLPPIRRIPIQMYR